MNALIRFISFYSLFNALFEISPPLYDDRHRCLAVDDRGIGKCLCRMFALIFYRYQIGYRHQLTRRISSLGHMHADSSGRYRPDQRNFDYLYTLPTSYFFSFSSRIKNLFFNKIKSATNGTYKLIGDTLRANPENLLYSFKQDEVKAKLVTGRHVIIHVIKSSFLYSSMI